MKRRWLMVGGWTGVVVLIGALGVVDAWADGWTQVTLDAGILPLENRVVALGPGMATPDLMVFTLWNTAPNVNHLGAFLVPDPYDGTGVGFTQDIDVGPLFGVGNICVIGENQVVIPYIKANGGNFDVFVAEYNGVSWSTSAIAATSADVYHTTDCFLTSDGIHLMVLNVTQDRWEFFQRPLPTEQRGSGGWIMIDSLGTPELGDPPQDPFDPGGAIGFARSRSSLFAQGTFDQVFQTGLPMEGDLGGYLLIGSSNTGDIDGAYLPRNYDRDPFFEQNADLPLRRKRGSAASDIMWVANQESGQLLLTRFGITDPGLDQTITLGSIGAGSLLSFQGIGIATGPAGNVYVLADKAYRVTPDLVSTQMTGYPFQGLGGPADIVFPDGMAKGFAVGPGSQVLGILVVDAIFLSGFEGGNTSAWSATMP